MTAKRWWSPSHMLPLYILLSIIPFALCATANTCITNGHSLNRRANIPIDSSSLYKVALFKRNSLNAAAASALAVSGRQCTSDMQCVGYRNGDHNKPQGMGNADAIDSSRRKARLGEYACIDGTCRYVVKSGELCSRANNCAAFQLNRRWKLVASAQNTSSAIGQNVGTFDDDDDDDQAQAWCAPQFCTLESTCGGAWTLPGAPRDLPPGVDASKALTNGTISCCRGFLDNVQCGMYSGAVDTCSSGFSCVTPNIVDPSAMRDRMAISRSAIVELRQAALEDGTPMGKCVSQEPHQQVWIGVLLVLIGGATLNIGLNLQKYAFRKRQENIEADLADAAAIAADKTTAFSQSPSAPSEIYFYSSEALNTHQGGMAKRNSAAYLKGLAEDRHATLNAASVVFPVSAASNMRKAGNNAGILDSRAPASFTEDNGIIDVSDAACREQHKQHETASTNAKQLRFSSCKVPEDSDTHPIIPVAGRQPWKSRLRNKISERKLRNTPFSSPVWAIGLVIFILGNVVNFVALQFAPQSLVAPLGAVSLVTNVIIAPLLNNEKISMFDIGGIALIIAGCVIVVVFSGIVQQDYRLCVLIQLLKAKPTVLYLCLIFAAILAIYVFLWSIERGMARYLMENHEIGDEDDAANASTANAADSASAPGHPALGQSNEKSCRSLDKSLENTDKNNNISVGPLAIPTALWTDELWTTVYARAGSEDKVSHNKSDEKKQPVGEPPVGIRAFDDSTVVQQEQGKAWQSRLCASGDMNKVDSQRQLRDLLANMDMDYDRHDEANTTNISNALLHQKGSKRFGNTRMQSAYARVRSVLFTHPLMCLDRYIRPIRPTSRYVKYGLPLAYASLGSLMATLTTLFAKSLVHLLSVSLFEHDNQFTSFIAWGILLVTAFTAASQVYWINQGLLRYDALLQVPVFYVVWTVFDIIGGGVYFNEFKMFTTLKYVMFAIGVGVIFSGVGLLSHRMKRG
ncbi:hypothetical protein LPJ66_006019 [Kickxella alabastrina]|uniref:Uncharacterized protein n=1 Tax=Kickxella alabastrina TaxID=61397 RepID=A0ACC1IL97_9FUNG|nr:hypothetical protein LPJ66_006019 [Kickxella alabastrina]